MLLCHPKYAMPLLDLLAFLDQVSVQCSIQSNSQTTNKKHDKKNANPKDKFASFN